MIPKLIYKSNQKVIDGYSRLNLEHTAKQPDIINLQVFSSKIKLQVASLRGIACEFT